MNMTLKEIKTMFAVGQLWTVTREGNKPLTVHGNTGTSVLPALNGTETRKIIEIRSKELVFCCIDQAGRPNRYTPLPKASQVVEARPGFLKFTYDNGTTITMVLGETPSAQTV